MRRKSDMVFIAVDGNMPNKEWGAFINMNNETLYQSDEYSLINHDDELIFNFNNNLYYLSSYPYEPCLYIKLDNRIITIIHNSFNTYEIVDMARNNDKIRAITGNNYDIKGICQLLICAINSKIYDTDISYLEKQLPHKIFSEQTEDVFYEELKKYNDCVLDYCIIDTDSEYNDEESHKKAVLFAMSKWANKLKDSYDIDITFDTKKMKANKINAKSFFEISMEDKEKSKQYWYLFLKPPHGCNYTIKDFERINNILFPKGYDELEIFDWSTDWSNYFEDGLEWWGARCVSIYDKNMKRFVIIGASATD